MDKIEFDLKQALAQARKIDDIADRLMSMSSGRYATTIQNVSCAWKGQNASQFLGKSQELQSDIVKQAKYLKNLSNTIEKNAKTIYAAEKKAELIAKLRDFFGGDGD